MMKSSASHAVANFLMTWFCSFLKRPRIRIAPTAGNQVMIERRLFVNTSVLVLFDWSASVLACITAPRGNRDGCAPVLEYLYEINRHGDEQTNHHHQRIIRRQSRLCCPHHR